MNTDLTTEDARVESTARFQALQAGQYWKALRGIPEEGIDAGTVLLIQSIRWVDDAPHTIILRPHPSKIGQRVTLKVPQDDGSVRDRHFRYDEHRFLLNDFLALFEFEPDHQQIRSEEVKAIQSKINTLQSELLEAQRNPALLASVVTEELAAHDVKAAENADTETATNLPAVRTPDQLASMATGTVANVIGAGITEAGVVALKQAAQREHQIATIKSKWIQGKTAAIAETITAMTPFYEEQAAAALAHTEDVRSYVTKLMQGIESLDLYVGKHVEVETLRTGEPAARDVPLAVVQKKLLMDEELAVWADIDEWFDFSQDKLFVEALQKHDGLVNQIFPAERCVLVMATTNRHIDYGNPWSSATQNAKNREVFLLIRDGMNIHRVYSPVESHLGAARLFPSQREQDKIFSGLDGTQIKFEDVAYTDKLADHDKHALHYKRFLLLLCGLDHRLKLLGDFYDGPPTFEFMSLAFQDDHFRFIHDDAGGWALPGETRASVYDWIREKNAYLRSGSRVLCNWNALMSPQTAPGACRRERDYTDRFAKPKNLMDVMIVRREGDDLVVDIEVTHRHTRRVFNAKVNLEKHEGHTEDMAMLCLDAVRPEELDWYIHNRPARSDHVFFIRVFKTALKFIRQERETEKATRTRLTQALADGRIATGADADSIIDQAVIAWRAANRGRPLPTPDQEGSASWVALLDQMYMLAKRDQNQIADVEEFLAKDERRPLRLVLSGGAKLVVYATPRDDERDDRLTPHIWVRRITLERGKTRLLDKGSRWVVLPEHAASETTLHEWSDATAWTKLESPFVSFEQKQAVFALADKGRTTLERLVQPWSTEQYDTLVQEWRQERSRLMEQSKYVLNPSLIVPIGVLHNRRYDSLTLLAVGYHSAHGLLAQKAPREEDRENLRHMFARPYNLKSKGYGDFDSALRASTWKLMILKVPAQPSRIEGKLIIGRDAEGLSTLEDRDGVDPLLDTWVRAWQDNGRSAEDRRAWFAPSLTDKDGNLSVDALLGISRPDDYCPYVLYTFTVHPHDEEKRPLYGRWIDTAPESVQPKDDDRQDYWKRREEHVPTGIGGYSSSGSRTATRAEALANIEKEARNGGLTVVAATALPDAPQAPEGFERWYLMKPATEQ